MNIKCGFQGESLRRIAQGMWVCICLFYKGDREPHGLYLWVTVTIGNTGIYPLDSSERFLHGDPSS